MLEITRNLLHISNKNFSASGFKLLYSTVPQTPNGVLHLDPASIPGPLLYILPQYSEQIDIYEFHN